MYSLRGYGRMIGDQRRTASYAEALRRTVRPGSVVLDIGTGTGILALIACTHGAKRVYAVEPADVIELGRELAALNGFQDRIEFIQGLSTEVELPERADVMVSDVRGILPIFENCIVTILDARDRLLAPGGTLIPARETIWATVVQAPALHAGLVSPWSESAHGVDLRPARRFATSEIHRAEFAEDDLLCPPATWAVLDYATLQGTDVSSRVSVTASRAGIGHGIAMWFDAHLCAGVEMSNSPQLPPLLYGNAFFPWPEPVAIGVGDTIELDVAANLLGGGRYLWRWGSRVLSGGAERAAFRQSQLDAALIVPEKLRRQAATYVPALNEAGAIERLVLDRIAERRPLGEIARELGDRYPRRFPSWEDALNHVGELALRCSD